MLDFYFPFFFSTFLFAAVLSVTEKQENKQRNGSEAKKKKNIYDMAVKFNLRKLFENDKYQQVGNFLGRPLLLNETSKCAHKFINRIVIDEDD